MLRRDDCELVEQGDGALGHLPAGWNMYHRSDGHLICAPADDFEQRTRPWSFRHLAVGEAWAAISDRSRIPTEPYRSNSMGRVPHRMTKTEATHIVGQRLLEQALQEVS